MKISQAFELYCIDSIRASGGSRKTEESYLNTSRLLISKFSDIDLTNLTFENIRDWRSHLETWLAPDTVRGCVINLRCVLRFMRLSGYNVVPFDTIVVPRRQKRTIDFLTPSEVEDFISILGRRTRGYNRVSRLRNIAIGRVLASSGIRVSELCSLNKNSIRDRKFTIIGKSKNPRICFIDYRAESAIKSYLSVRSDTSSALFLSSAGNRITPGGVRRIYQTACARSDFENVTPHTKRHSLATTLLDRGVELCYIADILGHQSLDTTKMYTHYSNTKLQHIYEKAML